MTLPVPTSEAQYGYVVGRVIRAIADGVDADNKPDIKAATGSVTFLPKAKLGRTSDYSAFVVREQIICPLDWQGFVTSKGAQYVVLTAGVYDVSFKLEAGTAIPSFAVEVTTAHTQDAPLDLVTAAPYSPPAGAVVQTMLVPAGAAVGQVLSWTAAGLGWVDVDLPDLSQYVLSTDPRWQAMASGTYLVPDPANVGLYLPTAGTAMVADPTHDGLYTIGTLA